MFAMLSCSVTAVYPQFPESDGWESVLETLLSDEELTADALEELSDMYESLHAAPLNINTATRDELSMLPFLSDRQIEDIHAYIYMHGPMLTLGELQLTGSLDYATRQLLRHFVYAGPPSPQKERIKMADVLQNGRTEVVARMDIPLYLRDGFKKGTYLGGRLSHNLRWSFNWHNRIRFGVSADKDAGERGYDFWSPYLFIKDMGVLKELAVGNFKAQFGQGLLLGGGFSVGKSMVLSSMSRQTQGLRPHSSTGEYGYLRGGGVALGWGHTTFTLLASRTPVDATLKGDTVISSFKEDGYHRTSLELSKKHNVTLGMVAANMHYSFRGLRFGVTAMTESLTVPYKGHGRLSGVSADCSVNRARYSLQAELSLLDSKPALIASQTFRLGNGWTANAVVRHYSPEYMSLHSNAMAESSVQNETGLLVGFAHSGRDLKVSGYADFFMHPEPRYGASAPSNGMDLRMEADWRVGRRDALYATARFKSKQKDCKYTGQLEYCLTGRYRLRWMHDCRSGAQLRMQFFYVRYDFIAEPITNGYALTGSFSHSLLEERLDVDLSAAAFHTQSYDCRVSVYESGFRYSYNFMSLYGKGGRLAVMVRYRLNAAMQLNVKAGGTYYLDRDEISSSHQRIASSHKEDISLQFITKF
jgi:hypothetical protein